MRTIVSKMSPALVAPAEPTPTGYLPLSFLDRLPAMRSYVDMIHVFRRGREPANLIRRALARTLVPYYPVAGRFSVRPGDGKLYVHCTGEGVWFVEASACCRLEDVDCLDCQPLLIPKEQLFPSPPPGVDQDALTFMIQVTEFKCGGFAIGFKCSHCIFDAIGVGQFINAISELARGLSQPSIRPVWRREAFPVPPNPQQLIDHQLSAAPPLRPTFRLEHCTMDLPPELISKLKNRFTEETGQNCSAFDIMTAMVWQCRTRAMDPAPDAKLTLNFPADVRQELQEELHAAGGGGGGYYGNCIYHVVVEAPSGEIAGAPLFEIVRLVSNAKEGLSTKFSRWLKGDPGENPLPLSFAYESVSFTDLRRVGFVKSDYGWGPPDRVVPIFDHPIGLCVFLNSPGPGKGGARLLTHCVVKEHLQAFKDEIDKFCVANSE